MGLFTKKPEDFEKKYGSVVMEYIKKMNDLNHGGIEQKDFSVKLAMLRTVFDVYAELKTFCESKPGGAEYFKKSFETKEDHKIGNYYNTIKHFRENLDFAERVYNEIVPAIEKLAEESCLQKDIYTKFDLPQNLIKQIIDEMEYEKLIRREKKGNTYVITLQ